MKPNKLNQNVFVSFIVFIFFLTGCSNDDTKSFNENGGDVYRYQIVTIDIPDSELDENEYDATFGGLNVMVSKTDEHQLAFIIPIQVDLGNKELVVSSLNMKVKYNVLEPQLEQTAEETIAPFISLSEMYFSTLENPNTQAIKAQNNFEQFKNYLTNTATTEDKEQIALYYQINKTAIDKIININNSAGRFTQEDIFTIQAFCGAVAITAGGGLGVRYLPEPNLKAISAVVTGIGIAGAIHFHDELSQRSIAVLGMKIDSYFGRSSEIQNSEIVLTNDVATTLPFQLTSRKLLQSDTNMTNSYIQRFFSSQSVYNDLVESVNTAVNLVNSYIPFSSPLSTFNLAALSSDNSGTDEAVTTEIMQDITFSINHPNLELVNASLQSNGQLNLKVKIIGTPSTTTVISTLNYSYNDDLSSIQGHFDLSVEPQLNYSATIIVDGIYTYQYNYQRNQPLYDSSMGYFIEFNEYQSAINGGFVQFYNVPNDESGSFDIEYTSQVPVDDGKIRARFKLGYYGSSYYAVNGTLTKTGTNSFTFTCMASRSSSDNITVTGTVTYYDYN